MSKPVVFIHDAAIDEYMAGMLLTTMDDVDLKGIIIVNADCVDGPAMNTGWKIQCYIDKPDIPLALSSARGWNAFPWPYRSDCVRLGNVEVLRNKPTNPDWPWYPSSSNWPWYPGPCEPSCVESPEEAVAASKAGYPSGDQLLYDLLENAANNGPKITVLINCPLTPVTELLKRCPELECGIESLVWMGGAVKGIQGNLDPATLPKVVANPYAEWNAFWDPSAVDWLLRNVGFPITVFPLNITNQASITPEFMSRLKEQEKCRYSALAYQGYSLVAQEPFYDMWDVVTTCYLTRPDLFKNPESMQLGIATQGYYQGTLAPLSTVPRSVDVVLDFACRSDFYDYVLHQFKRDS